MRAMRIGAKHPLDNRARGFHQVVEHPIIGIAVSVRLGNSEPFLGRVPTKSDFGDVAEVFRVAMRSRRIRRVVKSCRVGMGRIFLNGRRSDQILR